MSEKTEQPTDRRLKDAAEKGDLPRSQSFVTGLGMFAWWLVLPFGASAAFGWLLSYARRLLSLQVMQDVPASRVFFLEVLAGGLVIPCVISFTVAVGLGWVQTKGRFASKRSWFDLKRINPLSGLKQLFSLQRLLGIVMSLLRTVIVVLISFFLGRRLISDLQHTPTDRRQWTDLFMHALSASWKAFGMIVVACACLGLADFVMQQRLWIRRNKMSKEEVKREYRDREGDPQVKAIRKSIHREMT
jgi:type III secretion protein U